MVSLSRRCLWLSVTSDPRSVRFYPDNSESSVMGLGTNTKRRGQLCVYKLDTGGGKRSPAQADQKRGFPEDYELPGTEKNQAQEAYTPPVPRQSLPN